MKDKIEQLFISAIQGEWDSAYFAERMMALVDLEYKAETLRQLNVIKVASDPKNMVASWTSTDTEGLKLDLNIPI